MDASLGKFVVSSDIEMMHLFKVGDVIMFTQSDKKLIPFSITGFQRIENSPVINVLPLFNEDLETQFKMKESSDNYWIGKQKEAIKTNNSRLYNSWQTENLSSE